MLWRRAVLHSAEVETVAGFARVCLCGFALLSVCVGSSYALAVMIIIIIQGSRNCTRRFYLDSLADYRSPNSPLLVPPLLRLGFVGVLISVPVALVIKRAGYTHR